MMVEGFGDEVLYMLAGVVAALVAVGAWRRRVVEDARRVPLPSDDDIADALQRVRDDREMPVADGERDEGPRRLHDALMCPICLDPLRHACETSCGHSFCGECVLDYWKQLGEHRAVVCPVDRREVRFLVPSFTLRAQCPAVVGPPSPAEIDARIEEYNLQFEAVSRRWVAANLGAFGRLHRDFHRLLLHQKLIVVVILMSAVVYIIAPFDFLPEILFGHFGMLDDLLLIFFVLTLIGGYLRRIRRQLQQPIAQ